MMTTMGQHRSNSSTPLLGDRSPLGCDVFGLSNTLEKLSPNLSAQSPDTICVFPQGFSSTLLSPKK